ncbi:MAG: hypothetical protein EP329_16220, partial [Deltaproteobacteria bacterium]
MPESAVQDKLAKIRARRAERQAARAAGFPDHAEASHADVEPDEDEGEATQAFNIGDFDFDEEPAKPARQAAAAAPPPAMDDDDDDDEGE